MSSTVSRSPRTSVLVVVGFLGAGKTSLLRHLRQQLGDAGAAVRSIINDFAPLNVDTRILDTAAGVTPGGATDESAAADTAGQASVDLSGGCICCTLLPQFLTAASSALAELAATDAPERWLLVESTGIGDAGPIAHGLLGLPELAADGSVVLRGIVTVVDVVSAARLADDPVADLLLEQLRWGTAGVLTRVHDAQGDELQRSSALVHRAFSAPAPWRRQRPFVVPGDFGRVDLSRLVGPASDVVDEHCVLAAEYRDAWDAAVAKDGGEHRSEAELYGYRSVVVAAGAAVSFPEAATIESAATAGGLLDGVARSKGIVQLADAAGTAAPHEWASVGRSLDYAEVDAAAPPVVVAEQLPKAAVWIGGSAPSAASYIVFIGRSLDPLRLVEALQALAARDATAS